jgi:hypothetical protein
MTHRSKIARLPHALRLALNERLQNGENGKSLLAWLNGSPEARQMLAAEFSGAPINHENLSVWRRGAYAEWLDQRHLAESAQQLRVAATARETNAATLNQNRPALLVAELAHLARSRDATHPEEDWRRLRAIAKQANALKRHDEPDKILRLPSTKNPSRDAHGQANPSSPAPQPGEIS